MYCGTGMYISRQDLTLGERERERDIDSPRLNANKQTQQIGTSDW